MIGAGAAGLVASRHLLGQGLRPSIFEAAKTVGGAWSSGSQNSKMWNDLTTNLSKYTCRFSDLPWPEATPTFPTAHDMNKYLETYSKQFVDPACFRYHCKVTNIKSVENGYRVEWMDLNDQTKHSKDFEGVVVATGFFSKPHLLQTAQNDGDDRILHSEDYVSHTDFVNETVAVVGSSFSALEIAVDVSQSAERVVNILPRVPWVVPRLIPHPKDHTTILPVDLAFYTRPQDAPQIPETTVLSTPAACRSRHEHLQSMLGPRQQNSPLGIPPDFDEPPRLAISDLYLDLILDGTIDVIKGRLQGVDPDGLHIESPQGPLVLPYITKVICCTGYKPDLEEYLDESILKTIDYDRKDRFSPTTLCWETLHPALRNFAFCGMHRGAYMGTMELQARLAASVMSGAVQLGGDDSSKLQQALETSQEIRNHQPRAQFPHFDYIGFMDTLAELSGCIPQYNTQKDEMVAPTFYQLNDELSQACQGELQQAVELGQNGGRMPSLVLSALVGIWKFDRNIVHFTDNRREHIHGTVKYSRPKLDYVLYREDGLYELSPSKTLSVFREYEYLVKDDTLEVYFVERGQRAHLFLSLKFTKQNDEGYWVATSDHLCIKDLYRANFQVKLNGLMATKVIMTYRVKGPNKDYESTTTLTPLIQ